MYEGNTPDRAPQRTTDHGLRFMTEEQGGTKRPFCWYLAYTAPH